MLLKRLMITLLAAVTALALGLAAAAEDGAVEWPIHKNKEGAWSVQRFELGCGAWIDRDKASLLLKFAGAGLTIGADSGWKLKGREAKLLADDKVFAFRPQFGEGGGYVMGENVADSLGVATIKAAKSLAVVLDDQLLIGIETAGTGLPQLIDDLAACGRGEKGWWDAPKPAPAVNKEGFWRLSAYDGVCAAGSNAAEGKGIVFIESPDGRRTLSITPLPKGRLDRVTIENRDFWTSLPLTKDGDYAVSAALDARQNFLLRRATGLFIYLDGAELLNIQVEGTGYPQILDDLAACAAGKSGWWGDGAKPAAH